MHDWSEPFVVVYVSVLFSSTVRPISYPSFGDRTVRCLFWFEIAFGHEGQNANVTVFMGWSERGTLLAWPAFTWPGVLKPVTFSGN